MRRSLKTIQGETMIAAVRLNRGSGSTALAKQAAPYPLY